MKICVISLKNSQERRQAVKQQMDILGIDFEFFDAITPDDPSCRFYRRLDRRKYLINTGRHPSPTEIACYASHYALWLECIRSKSPMLIMEDDFTLTPDFKNALVACQSLADQYGYIRLQEEYRARSKAILKHGEFTLSRYTRVPHCMMAYSINPSTAKAFVRLSETLSAPVDVMLKKHWEHKQAIYGLTPYSVIASPHSSDSTIKGRQKHRKPLHIQLQRFLTKATWPVRNALIYFTWRFG
ncbi:putative Lex2B [gamma proteobacterium HTCC5015]|nr:putative Lex2B [gamma proteobacterium HTCC5015]